MSAALSTYDECLRAHGVALPAGASGLGALKHVDTHSAAFKGAVLACRGALSTALRSAATSSSSTSTSPGSPASTSPTTQPPSTTLTAPAPQIQIPASVTATMRSFTACMRSHDIVGFPEPTGASFDLSGTHIDTHSASYKAAEAACNHILQALDR